MHAPKETPHASITITLLNYDCSKQASYRKNFMRPLIEGLYKRTQLTPAKQQPATGQA